MAIKIDRDKIKALVVQKLDLLACSSVVDKPEQRWAYEDILAEEIIALFEQADPYPVETGGKCGTE